MRARNSWLVAGAALALAVGCRQPTSAPAPASSALAAAPEERVPRFESEFTVTSKAPGGASSHSTGQNQFGDKTYHVISGFKHTDEGPGRTLSYEIDFVRHRDGKDIYKVSYSVRAGGQGHQTTKEVAYDGTRTVLVEDEYAVAVLHPPAQ